MFSSILQNNTENPSRKKDNLKQAKSEPIIDHSSIPYPFPTFARIQPFNFKFMFHNFSIIELIIFHQLELAEPSHFSSVEL
jgi:hypothetical protein